MENVPQKLINWQNVPQKLINWLDDCPSNPGTEKHENFIETFHVLDEPFLLTDDVFNILNFTQLNKLYDSLLQVILIVKQDACDELGHMIPHSFNSADQQWNLMGELVEELKNQFDFWEETIDNLERTLESTKYFIDKRKFQWVDTMVDQSQQAGEYLYEILRHNRHRYDSPDLLDFYESLSNYLAIQLQNIQEEKSNH